MNAHDDSADHGIPDLAIPGGGHVLSAIEVRTTDDADLTEILVRLREAGAEVVTINSFPATKQGEGHEVTRVFDIELRDLPPMEATEANQQLWRMAQTLGDELGMELQQGTAGGGSDGNTTSLYSATLDGLGAVGDGAHADHEFIEIDRLEERCALLTLLLLAPPLVTDSTRRTNR